MAKGSRGGRRSSGSNSGGRTASLKNLINQVNQNISDYGSNWQRQGDYDNNGNPALQKFQGQDDDKTANFLAGTYRNVDFANYDDGYEYHDIPLNKLLLRTGVKGGTTILNDSDFDDYVKQTGQKTMYRGWSGSAAADRFEKTTNNHVGNGIYGDGYYFSTNLSTAKAYSGKGSVVTKIALSPTARVISYSDLQAKMSKASPKLQSALRKAGTTGSGRTYGSNKGEAQFALKLGYNVVDMGTGYLYGITNDAFVISKKRI